MNEKRNIPTLRFPEFDGEWALKKIGDVATFQRGFDLPSRERLEGKYPIVSSSGISGYHKSFKVDPPGIVTGRYGSVGNLFYVTEPFWPLNTSLWVKNFHGNLLKFLFYSISTINFKKLSDKTGVPGINRNELHKEKTSLPSLPEQQKIADFLTTIDTRLQQLTQKVALLKAYKKGVMQRIFSQELRFTDEQGKAFPEWEEKALGEVFNLFRTNSFSRNLLTHIDGRIQNIHYGDIHTKFKTCFDLSKAEVPFLKKEVDVSKIPEESFCQEGDLVIADASEDYEDIGKAIEIVKTNNKKLLAGLHTILMREKQERMAPGYKGYMIRSRPVRLQIMKLAAGAKVLGISKSNIVKVRIPIPSYPEQQKIAAFLRALDQKIDRTQEQLQHTQTYKRGLLQQLFV